MHPTCGGEAARGQRRPQSVQKIAVGLGWAGLGTPRSVLRLRDGLGLTAAAELLRRDSRTQRESQGAETGG